MNIEQYVSLMEYLDLWVENGNPIDNSPIESFHASFKREVLYSNNITSIEKYIELAEKWLKFYNTDRIKLGHQ